MFVTNLGTAEAVNNVLNVLGISGTTTSAPGSSNTINITSSNNLPTATLNEWDDFLATPGTTGSAHTAMGVKLGWQSPGSGLPLTANAAGTATNPGIAIMEAASQNNYLFLGDYLSSAAATGPIALGGGITTITWIIQLSALSAGGNTYRFSCGLADGVTLNSSSDSFVNGVFFQYTNSINAGQWTLNTTASSATTTQNSTTAAGTSFVKLAFIVNAAASSVQFFINGVGVGTPIVTTIPTAAITPFCFVTNLSGTTPVISLDLFWVNIALTTPR
jgi:hypothetical protein